MIGVIANPAEGAVVREFFELFKTPWEFWRGDRHYDIVIAADHGRVPASGAKVVLIYAGRQAAYDLEAGIQPKSQLSATRVLSYKGTRLPLYGLSVTFRANSESELVDAGSQQSAIDLAESDEGMVARIGYDLFSEIRMLLEEGQPANHASTPTLELHISILRDLIVRSGVSLVEIPPVPEGYQFIACLTHDVDHPSVRLHGFDHTIVGFLQRAVFGSVVNLLRGRLSVRMLLKNWAAVLKLPLVHLGLARDFWLTFDIYRELEAGAPSSFFFIPFKDDPGQKDGTPAPSYRASRYSAAEFATEIRKLVAEGCEVGLHGMNAWADSSKGHEELGEIRRLTGAQNIGVRMHWLYFEPNSPVALEQAGAAYDSTVGYNETVGYRAGTTQVYKPLASSELLELPLHVMDTALFYPAYLNLSPGDALKRVSQIINHAVQMGGCITVNWHDRSIAPERLWGTVYTNVVQELRDRGAWFATASQTVAWFRKRRSAVFQEKRECGTVDVKSELGSGAGMPNLQLRTYNFHGTPASSRVRMDSAVVTDTPIACDRT